MKIFLSHCSGQNPLIRDFKNKLPKFLTTWLDDESIKWGANFQRILEKEIKSEVDFLIIFFDKDSLKSEWVAKELDWAIQREQRMKRTFILPILIGDVKHESIPPEFSKRRCLHLYDTEEDSVDELARKATNRLFQLVLESYAGEHQDRKIEPIEQGQFSGKRQQTELREDEIKILLALNKAANEPEPEKKYLSLLEIAGSIDMQVSKVDYFFER
jgi:hypothetical protein